MTEIALAPTHVERKRQPPSPAKRLALLAAIGVFLTAGCLLASPSLLRLALPAYALAAALCLRQPSQTQQLLMLVLALFLLTPLLRRLVDLHAGWESQNYLMLAPYTAGSILVPMALLRGGRRSPTGWCCIAAIAISLYGCLLAVLMGRVQAGLLEFLRWATPPSLALCLADYLAGDVRRSIRIDLACLVAVPLLGAYGIYQYVAAPPWDTLWMVNSQMDSIGKPLPFQLRVFGTFNSPGSLGFVFLFGLLVLLGSRSRWRWIGLGLGTAAFALTLHRSAWLGLLLGAAWITLLGDRRARFTIGAAVLAAALAIPFALALPEVGQVLETRLNSFTELGTDGSAYDRSAGYRHAMDDLDEHPFGAGLGIAGAYQAADGSETKVIDGGPIEIVLSLGLIGGFAYLLAVTVAVTRCLSFRPRDPQIAGQQGSLLAFFVLLTSGTTTAGEIGLFFWISVGILEGRRAQAARIAAAS